MVTSSSSTTSSTLSRGDAESPRAARAAAPAAQPRGQTTTSRIQYWFAFDRWLPVRIEEQDDFVLA